MIASTVKIFFLFEYKIKNVAVVLCKYLHKNAEKIQDLNKFM